MISELMILFKKENDLKDSIVKWIQQCQEEDQHCVKTSKKLGRAIDSEFSTLHKSQNDYSYWTYWIGKGCIKTN